MSDAPQLLHPHGGGAEAGARWRAAVAWGAAAAVAVAAGVVLALHLGDRLPSVDAVRGGARALARHPWGPLLAFGVFTVGAAAFVPITLLLTTTLLTFGPWRGGIIAYAGGLAAASLTFAGGRLVGAAALERLLTQRWLRVQHQLARRGFAAVLLARLLPVGNFALINLLAGAFRIPFPKFIAGNAVGLLPGVLGFGVVMSRLVKAVQHPSALNIAVLVGVVAATGALAFVTKRVLRRREMRDCAR